jgi:hypothetical protein
MPEVEFYTEDVDGVEYLNIGLQWVNPEGEPIRAVLGAFQGDMPQEAMIAIKGLVEQACIYVIQEERGMEFA